MKQKNVIKRTVAKVAANTTKNVKRTVTGPRGARPTGGGSGVDVQYVRAPFQRIKYGWD